MKHDIGNFAMQLGPSRLRMPQARKMVRVRSTGLESTEFNA